MKMDKQPRIVEGAEQAPESVLFYRNSQNLPEVSLEKIKALTLPDIGWAIEYKNGDIIYQTDVKYLTVDINNPPVAISYLGKDDNSPE